MIFLLEQIHSFSNIFKICPELIFCMPISLKLGLDVVRTDRSLLYYESSDNQARLWDVLAVYSWIDRDIGYCQGGNLHILEIF